MYIMINVVLCSSVIEILEKKVNSETIRFSFPAQHLQVRWAQNRKKDRVERLVESWEVRRNKSIGRP